MKLVTGTIFFMNSTTQHGTWYRVEFLAYDFSSGLRDGIQALIPFVSIPRIAIESVLVLGSS
jgi:hypothetical protein